MKTSIYSALKNTKAAIDLTSIMVGVVVIGILGGVIAATVFAVIPWSQDNAAKAALGSVQTAQSAYSGQNAVYGTYKNLQDAKFLPVEKTLNVLTGTNNTCYTAISASATGKVFYNTNLEPAPKEYFIGTTKPSCGDSEATDAAANQAAGNPPINNFAVRKVTRTSLVGYSTIAASDDNMKAVIFGRDGNGSTYDRRVTTNGGLTWSAPIAMQSSLSTAPIASATANSDGTIVLIGLSSGAPWISRDGGTTFTQVTGITNGSQVAMSSNGQVMYAGSSTSVAVSLDSGATWTTKGTGDFFNALSTSSDGTKAVVISQGGRVSMTTDSGSTWVVKTNPSADTNYRSISISDDGSKLVAVTQSKVFVSKDSGSTWTQVKTESDSTRYYLHVDVSRDGTKIVVTSSSKGFLTSTDLGETWIDPTTAEQLYTGSPWFLSKISSNGQKIFTVMGSSIYSTEFSAK